MMNLNCFTFLSVAVQALKALSRKVPSDKISRINTTGQLIFGTNTLMGKLHFPHTSSTPASTYMYMKTVPGPLPPEDHHGQLPP